MREKRERKSRFWLGMLIYVLIFALLAGAALYVLRLYLRAYEDSRVGTCLDRCLLRLTEEPLGSDWTKSLEELDARLVTEEEGLAFIQSKIKSADCREIRSRTAGEKRYGLFDEDGQCFATLTLAQGEADRWGFRPWELSGVECELGPYVHSYSVTVPSDYRVCLGETELDERFIVERGIPYETLESCRELVPRQPTMLRYEAGPTLNEGPLRVLNAGGREIPEKDQNELYYLSNCSSTVRAYLEDFCLRYLDAYLPYAGDLYRNGLGYWGDLSPMIVHGGELEDRLIAVRGSFGFGNTRSIAVVDHAVNACVDFKDGHYLVDLFYRTETVGLEGPVQEDNRVRLLLLEENEKLFAEAMYHY